jgi:hypothetical protein
LKTMKIYFNNKTAQDLSVLSAPQKWVILNVSLAHGKVKLRFADHCSSLLPTF